jgi:hypothetical protein
MNVKWLDHLELCRDPGSNAGETIALRRMAALKLGGSEKIP